MKGASAILWLLLVLGLMCAGCTREKELPAAEPAKAVLSGYVVDAMCGSAISRKSDPMSKAARHTRSCALAEACAAEGYGIVAGGRWILFDERGNALANAALEKDERQEALYFSVQGRLEGDRLAVTSIDPLGAPELPGERSEP